MSNMEVEMNSNTNIRSNISRIPVPSALIKSNSSNISRIPVPSASLLIKNKNVVKDSLKVPAKKINKNVFKPNGVCKVQTKVAVTHSLKLKTFSNKSARVRRSPLNKNTAITSRTCKERSKIVKQTDKLLPSGLKLENTNLTNLKVSTNKANLQKENRSNWPNPKIPTNSVTNLQASIKYASNKSKETHTLCEVTKFQAENNNPTLKNIAEKENKLSPPPSHLEEQKDIKFEADEKYRRMILTGDKRVMSPLVSRMSGRSSFYNLGGSTNPHQETLRALENLSIKKDRKTSLSLQSKAVINASPLQNRYSLYGQQSTYHNSFYTPNPKEFVQQALGAIELKKLMKSNAKSSKKVSFNLKVEEINPLQKIDVNPTPFKTEGRLTNISEKSEENTPNSPSGETCTVTALKDDQQTNCSRYANTPPHPSFNFQKAAYLESDKNFIFRTPQSNLLSIQRSDCHSLIRTLSKNVTEKITNSVTQSLKKLDFKSVPRYRDTDSPSNCYFSVKNEKVDGSQDSLQFISQQNNEPANNLLFTPKQFSICPESSSLGKSNLKPESLVDHESNLTKIVPIGSPSVLRSLVKSSLSTTVQSLSEVRLKLNFTGEKDTPKQLKDTARAFIEKIAANQKRLDDLADQECSFFLSDETFPVLCGRYLSNPIIATFTEQDEMFLDDMHFKPIKS